MKAIFNLFIVRKSLACLLAAAALLAWCSTANAYQNPIYFEGFEGTGARLDETTEDQSGTVIWSANGFATDNGVIDTGDATPTSNEGSATLPITLVTDTIYTVQMDVTPERNK